MRVRLIRVPPTTRGTAGCGWARVPGGWPPRRRCAGRRRPERFRWPANEFAAPDGLTPAEVQGAIHAIAAARPICSASVAAYDPSADPEGRALEAGLRLIDLLADLAG